MDKLNPYPAAKAMSTATTIVVVSRIRVKEYLSPYGNLKKYLTS